MEAGRHFLHEHPTSATSWKLECMREVSELPDVCKVRADICQFSLRTKEGEYDRKPATFLTHAAYIANELSRNCPGVHHHQVLIDGRANAAAQYA